MSVSPPGAWRTLLTWDGIDGILLDVQGVIRVGEVGSSVLNYSVSRAKLLPKLWWNPSFSVRPWPHMVSSSSQLHVKKGNFLVLKAKELGLPV